mgnify:CR=1 FL=1
MRTLKIMGQFALYGPPIGGIPAFALIAWQDRQAHHWADHPSPLAMVAGYFVYAYLFGLAPAVLTGLLLALFDPSPSPLAHWLIKATLIGGTVGFLCGLAVEAHLFGLVAFRLPYFGWFIGVPAAFGALGCAALVRPPNPPLHAD